MSHPWDAPWLCGFPFWQVGTAPFHPVLMWTWLLQTRSFLSLRWFPQILMMTGSQQVSHGCFVSVQPFHLLFTHYPHYPISSHALISQIPSCVVSTCEGQCPPSVCPFPIPQTGDVLWQSTKAYIGLTFVSQLLGQRPFII